MPFGGLGYMLAAHAKHAQVYGTVFEHLDEALERVWTILDEGLAVSVEIDNVGRWVVLTANKSNVEEITLGKRVKPGTDTSDTIAMAAYDAAPAMTFVEFIGLVG
jgi:hypothetical protein